MRPHLLLAVPAAALLGALPLAHCNQFQINCVTVENCLQGQVCVAGLCQDSDGGGTPCADGGDSGACGAGGASGTGGSHPDGGESDGGNADGGEPDGGNVDGGNPDGGKSDGGNPDGGACSSTCSGTTPYCVGGACVQCTQATMSTDCKGEKCCPNGSCSLAGLCL